VHGCKLGFEIHNLLPFASFLVGLSTTVDTE